MERRNLYDFPQSPIYLWTEFISKSISMQEMGAKVAGECWDYSGVLWQQRLSALWKQEEPGRASSYARWQHQGPVELMLTPRTESALWERKALWALTADTSHLHMDPHPLEALENSLTCPWVSLEQKTKKRIRAFWSLKELFEAYVRYHLRAGGPVWELVIW